MINRNNEWFANEFLPSLEKRMTNPKYPNKCILTEKQADICCKYMKAIQHKDASYNGTFYTYEFETDIKKYQMSFAGRYTFLSVYKKAI